MNSDGYGRATGKSISRFPRRATATMLLLSVSMASPGCGASGPKGPQGTVHGKVTIKGAPAPAGTVVSFLGETGAGASGMVGAEGSYRLVGAKGADEVPTGTFKIVLMPASPESSLTSDQQMEASMKAQQSGQTPAPPTESIIPAKYSNPTTTTETREVKEGDNEINIDVTE